LVAGTAVPVTIQSCIVEGPPGKHYQRCTGTWRAADGTEKTVTIDDTPSWRQSGDTVAAHVHGDKATVDSRTVEIFFIATRCGLLGLVVITVIASLFRPNFWI